MDGTYIFMIGVAIALGFIGFVSASMAGRDKKANK
jgi:hypothetical protein